MEILLQRREKGELLVIISSLGCRFVMTDEEATELKLALEAAIPAEPPFREAVAISGVTGTRK